MFDILQGTVVDRRWDWLAAEPELADLQIVTQFIDRTSASHSVGHPTRQAPPPSAICRPSATRHSVTPACRLADKAQAAALTQGGRRPRCETYGLLQTMRLWLAFGPLGDAAGTEMQSKASYERGAPTKQSCRIGFWLGDFLACVAA